MAQDLVAEALGPTHALQEFDCGNPPLNLWLHQVAMRAEAKRTSRTFVFHRFDNRVIGYYALSADVLTRGALPGSLAHGETDRIPAVLLARMAVDRRAHGHGLGRVLLGDAFARVSALDVGARYLIVDAIDEQAAAFYDHHAFRRIPGTLRLVHKTTRPL